MQALGADLAAEAEEFWVVPETLVRAVKKKKNTRLWGKSSRKNVQNHDAKLADWKPLPAWPPSSAGLTLYNQTLQPLPLTSMCTVICGRKRGSCGMGLHYKFQRQNTMGLSPRDSEMVLPSQLITVGSRKVGYGRLWGSGLHIMKANSWQISPGDFQWPLEIIRGFLIKLALLSWHWGVRRQY